MKNIKSFEAFDNDIDNKRLYLNVDSESSIKSDMDKTIQINKTSKNGFIDKLKDKFYSVSKVKELVSKVKWENLIVKDVSKVLVADGENSIVRVFLPDEIQSRIRASKINFDYVEFKIDNIGFDNRTHTMGIDDKLKGLGLGYKCYKALAKHLGWLTSHSNASSDAKNVWRKLIKDNDFYSILSKYSVMIIDKSLSKDNVKIAILKFLSFNYIKIEGETDNEIIKKLAGKQFPIKMDNELRQMFKDDVLIRRLDIDYFDRINKFRKEEDNDSTSNLNSKINKKREN